MVEKSQTIMCGHFGDYFCTQNDIPAPICFQLAHKGGGMVKSLMDGGWVMRGLSIVTIFINILTILVHILVPIFFILKITFILFHFPIILFQFQLVIGISCIIDKAIGAGIVMNEL